MCLARRWRRRAFSRFFLESGFLAVVVFGWDRVKPRTHFFATCMVAMGAVFSSIWIVVANSWQQTPAGFHLVNNQGVMRAEITDFWAMVFNPSSVHRLAHVLIGCYILAAFFVMSISAYYLLKNRHVNFARKSFTSALVLGTVMSLLALIQGDVQSRKVAATQPAKLAAMEAHFETGTNGSPLYLFGIPDERAGRVKYGIAIPRLLSFMVHGKFDKPVDGLDKVPREDWPPVAADLPLVPHHGGAGHAVHRHDGGGEFLPLARNAVGQALAAVGIRAGHSPALRRQPDRLGHRRGRPATVDCVWAAAHEGCALQIGHRRHRRSRRSSCSGSSTRCCSRSGCMC